MLRTSSAVFVCAIVLGGFSRAAAQDVHFTLPPAQPQFQDLRLPLPSMAPNGPGTGDDVQRQQAIAVNQQRQMEIRRDTEKMLALTAELKDYLQKADKGIMSVDAIKKAEQIEKLAHGVKSKMKLAF